MAGLEAGVSARPAGPAVLPWHPGWPGTVWKPERQAQYAAFSVRTQRASSPQMLALVAQLVSLGSARTESKPGLPLPALPVEPCTPPPNVISPMLQSSSSEPSPQSSNMLQRSEEERQRWFRHRNSFLSLQWGLWAVGGSGGGRGFRS